MRHLLLSTLFLTACGGRGALGQATMLKDSPTAAAAPLAVGARLRPDVSVDMPGVMMPVVALSTSRPDVVAIEDGALVGRAPGMAAVLIATRDGTVIDFQHVWVAAPTAIVIERTDGEEIVGPLQLVAGEQLMLRSAMIGGAQRLAGDGDLAWTIEGDGVDLLHDGATGRRRVMARTPGHARVIVAALGVETAIDVEVVP